MICLTIDCEQWTSPKARGFDVAENDNTDFSRHGNESLLGLFEDYGIKSTFFVTGFFAQREKKHIRLAEKCGHEIACHGYSHDYRGNKSLDIRKDISTAKKILEKLTRKKVIGFRAPQMQYSENLTKILKQSGFRYDSSLNPAFLPFWINNSAHPLKPFNSNGIVEIPVGAMPCTRLPLNWVFIRVLPYKYLEYGVSKLMDENITPVLYVHSWEFIELKSKFVPWYFKKNTGKQFIKKIERLIREFKAENFGTMEKIVQISPPVTDSIM